MKIVCVSAYDKFSRFYLGIHKELNSYTTSSIKIYSVYFSGFLYCLIRLKFSSFISLKSWIRANFKKSYYHKIINEHSTYKGLNYSSLINFHLGLKKVISKRKLQIQALAYIDIFDKIYTTEKPDYLISIGDSKLCMEVAISLAKSKGIKVYFIEQGPFNTTFFDDQGVNANLSIRKNKPVERHFKLDSVNQYLAAINYSRSPIYRGLDLLLMKLLENTMLYPPDLKFTDFNSYIKSINHKKLQVNPYKFDYAIFAMQVPMDVNMIYHSPYYKNQLDILIDLHKHLPSNIKLVVREHPLYIGKYGKELYGFIESNEIIIDNASSLDEILENSSIVIVNNSTVGFEAICKYKPVVVLGNAYYDNERICLKLNNHSSLSEILKNALEKPVNKGEIDRFKETLYSSVMLMGGITNKQLLSAKTIAKHLISQ